MKMYKIQRLSDGLYSTGGSKPGWTKQGKVWTRLNHITAHLTLVRDCNAAVYANCCVLVFDATPENTHPIVNGEMGMF